MTLEKHRHDCGNETISAIACPYCDEALDGTPLAAHISGCPVVARGRDATPTGGQRGTADAGRTNTDDDNGDT